MNANRQILLNRLAALAAFLACASGIHFHQQDTGTFSLVAQLKKELSPSCIKNALGKSSASHSQYVQRLDGYQLMLTYQSLAQMVRKVGTLVLDLQVDTLMAPKNFPSVLAFVLLSGDASTHTGKLALQPAEISRVVNLLPVGKCCERFQANVNADSRLDWLEWWWIIAVFGNYLSEPFTSPKYDAKLLRFADELADVAPADRPDACDVHLAAVLDDLAWIQDCKTTPSTCRFEARETWLLGAFLDAPEETLVGKVKPPQSISLNPNGNITEDLADRTENSQVLKLVKESKRFTRFLVIRDALGKAVVVEFASNVEIVEQAGFLGWSGVQAVDIGSQHKKSVPSY